MNIYKFHSNPVELIGYDDQVKICPAAALSWALAELIDIPQSILNTIAKEAFTSFKWAYYTNKPFPLGEDAIATNAQLSYKYALLILNKAFKKGEPAIAQHPVFSLRYATKVLKDRFPAGEPTIKNSQFKHQYEEQFGIKL